MNDARHEPFDGLAALYAMGALSDTERTEFESHLEVCRACVDEVTALLPVTHGLAHAAPPLDPPAGLRARVIESATGRAAEPAAAPSKETLDALFTAEEEPELPTVHIAPQPRGPGVLFWLAATLLLAAAGATGWYVAELDREITELRATLDAANALTAQANTALDTARRETADRDAVLALISEPGVQRLDLAGQPIAPRAAARVLWNPDRTMAFLASEVPALPAGDIYQLWYVLPDGPLSAALVEPDPEGSVTTLFEVPETVALPVTMALTIEPFGGMPAPTGDIYLLGQVE